MANSPHIFDVDAAGFESAVIEASREQPVLVDFWAEWCGPCRTLAPMLEQIVDSYAGRVRLAKVDTEAAPDLAATHGIRSLPTVRLFKDGQAVEEFMGVQPESVIRELIERHVPRDSDAARERAALARAEGDDVTAIAILEAALATDPDNHRIHADLALVLIDAGRVDEASAILATLPASVQTDGVFATLRSRIELVERSAGAAAPDDLRASIESNPADLESRYQLSALLASGGSYREAMDELLEIVRRDRKFRDDAGRKGLISMFELLGDDPMVREYRDRMATVLF